MLAIVTKYAFEVVDIPDSMTEELRTVCDPAYLGPGEPADILASAMSAMAELRELVIVDEGKIIYDDAV